MVKLGHVALDGIKIRANASKHKLTSYARKVKVEDELAAKIEAWFDQAAANTNKAREFGAETPDWMADKHKRLAKIREAKAALEAEAEGTGAAQEQARKRAGRKPKAP